MKKAIAAVRDKERDLLFRIGDRVHWYEYSADMIIMNGGFGLIIEIEKHKWESGNIPFLKIMKDGGCELRSFPVHDCDLEENWED